MSHNISDIPLSWLNESHPSVCEKSWGSSINLLLLRKGETYILLCGQCLLRLYQLSRSRPAQSRGCVDRKKKVSVVAVVAAKSAPSCLNEWAVCVCVFVAQRVSDGLYNMFGLNMYSLLASLPLHQVVRAVCVCVLGNRHADNIIPIARPTGRWGGEKKDKCFEVTCWCSGIYR